MGTSFLLFEELAHDLFYLTQFLVELCFIDLFLFPEDARNEQVVHVSFANAQRLVLVG